MKKLLFSLFLFIVLLLFVLDKSSEGFEELNSQAVSFLQGSSEAVEVFSLDEYEAVET